MEFTFEDLHKQVTENLKAKGFDGLYYPGECACLLDDLMPCGNCDKEDDEDFVNGCEGGYKHSDPADPAFYVISANKTPPKVEDWPEIHARYE